MRALSVSGSTSLQKRARPEIGKGRAEDSIFQLNFSWANCALSFSIERSRSLAKRRGKVRTTRSHVIVMIPATTTYYPVANNLSTCRRVSPRLVAPRSQRPINDKPLSNVSLVLAVTKTTRDTARRGDLPQNPGSSRERTQWVEVGSFYNDLGCRATECCKHWL